MRDDRGRQRTMSHAEALDLLAALHVGRIALTEHAMPTIIPVVYALDAGRVIIAAGSALLASAARHRHVVCFEVDEENADRTAIRDVTIIGRLEVADAARPDPADRHFGDWLNNHPVSMLIEGLAGRSTRAR